MLSTASTNSSRTTEASESTHDQTVKFVDGTEGGLDRTNNSMAEDSFTTTSQGNVIPPSIIMSRVSALKRGLDATEKSVSFSSFTNLLVFFFFHRLQMRMCDENKLMDARQQCEILIGVVTTRKCSWTTVLSAMSLARVLSKICKNRKKKCF